MGKKRKADTDEHGTDFKIKFIKDSDVKPILISFPSAYNPKSGSENWSFHQHAETNAHAIIAETANNVDFLGTAVEPNEEEHSNSTLLGIFNRDSGKLFLSPVLSSKPVRMEPRIRGRKYVSNELGDELRSPSGDTIELRRERNARLIQAFGSQRRKKQLHNAQAGRVDASQLTSGEAMLHLIRSTKADPGIREEVIKESLSHRNIPPHNSKATTADEAYPFDQIIPKIVRDSLDTSLLEKASQDNSVLSEITKVLGPYVASRVAGSTLINIGSSSHLERTRCLVFLGYLLKFASDMGKLVIRVKTEQGGIQAVAEKFHMTTSLLEGILDLFYSREDLDDGSKYILDKTKRNLMLTWCLLLAIRAEPESTLPSFAFQTLCDQLKMKPVDVAAIFRELGCLTKRASGGYVVTLLKSSLGEDSKTLEDSFPPLKLGGKKR